MPSRNLRDIPQVLLLLLSLRGLMKSAEAISMLRHHRNFKKEEIASPKLAMTIKEGLRKNLVLKYKNRYDSAKEGFYDNTDERVNKKNA